MKKLMLLLFALVALATWPSCGPSTKEAPVQPTETDTVPAAVEATPRTIEMPSDAIALQSPDEQLELQFAVIDGVPYYALEREGQAVVMPSKMGFTLEWRDDLAHAFVLKDTKYSTFDETWEPVWGEEAQIRNHYNEMLVTLEQPVGSVASMDHSTEKKATVMQIRFRLYDDGLGFRYEFPMENALVYFWIKEELTEFAMTGDHTAWWIPGDLDRNSITPSRGCHRFVSYGMQVTKTAAGRGQVSPRQVCRPLSK